MTLILELPEELEASLNREAERLHVPAQEVVLNALQKELRQDLDRAERIRRNAGIIALVEEWKREVQDPANQESLEDVFKSMNDNRIANGERELFPAELKGITW